MSDSYDINGVTVTPQGGGYYDLTHPSLATPERVRGKEHADARAAAIAAAAVGPDDADKPLQQPDPTLLQVPPVLTPVPETTLSNPAAPDPRDAAIAALTARLDAFEKAPVRTVTTDETPVDQIPAHVPREYRGQMDAKTKAALKAIGVTVLTIVLEENDSIPPTGLFIGHNGRSYMIQPGEEVDAPDFLLGVLDDAIMSTPQVDDMTKKVVGYRNRSKYPYRRV